jgi:hypothetical protein
VPGAVALPWLVEAVAQTFARIFGGGWVAFAVAASLVMAPRWVAVSPPIRQFQAATAAIWWRWSLVRLWAIISKRNSVRTFVLPRRWKRMNPLLCLVSP